MKKALTILLIVCACQCQAQPTRFYTNTWVPYVIPAAVNAGWNVTQTGYVVSLMNRYIDRTNAGTIGNEPIAGVAPRKGLIRGYITLPLAGQTLNCTVTGQVLTRINSVASSGGEGWVYLRLINANGTVASELGSMTTTALTATLTNRTYGPLTLTGVVVTTGQRLSIELGWNMSLGTNTTRFGSVVIQALPGTDLPVDNTTTTSLRDWFEFSQTIRFQQEGTGFW